MMRQLGIRMCLPLLALLIFLPACGGVRAGNPGDTTPSRFRVQGLVLSAEDHQGVVLDVTAVDKNDVSLVSVRTNDAGEFTLKLKAGTYKLTVGPAYEMPLTVVEDTHLTIVVPIPAAPKNFRKVEIGLWQGLCLTWDDDSGLENTFEVVGPQKFTLPSNHNLFRTRPEEMVVLSDNREGEALVTFWNENFAGTWFIWSENEYGRSVSTSVEVFAHDFTNPWPPGRGDYEELETCRGDLNEPYITSQP